jgi:hypothetical protein
MNEKLTDYEIRQIEAFIYALRTRTLICSMKVSSSGMTRKLNFIGVHNGLIWHLNGLFKLEGYGLDKNGNVIVRGCGMDMIWNTVYNMAYKLNNLGFIADTELQRLSQNSAIVI